MIFCDIVVVPLRRRRSAVTVDLKTGYSGVFMRLHDEQLFTEAILKLELWRKSNRDTMAKETGESLYLRECSELDKLV